LNEYGIWQEFRIRHARLRSLYLDVDRARRVTALFEGDAERPVGRNFHGARGLTAGSERSLRQRAFGAGIEVDRPVDDDDGIRFGWYGCGWYGCGWYGCGWYGRGWDDHDGYHGNALDAGLCCSTAAWLGLSRRASVSFRRLGLRSGAAARWGGFDTGAARCGCGPGTAAAR
jgi:hypothetical protein